MLISKDGLYNVAARIVEATGAGTEEAAIVADHLVDANLSGHDSHGVGMLPIYIRSLKAGNLHPGSHATVLRDEGGVMVVDGGMGYGQVVATEAMDLAIRRARETGVVAQNLINAHHIGRVGTYGEQVVAEGLISIHFVNVSGHVGLVAPHRGTDARLSTNPICIAVPATAERAPTVLDFATSKIAMGKTRVAMDRGEPVPEGTLIDRHGRPTTDPGVMWPDRTGALLPLAEHKGYGLALICEILGAALGGGPTIQAGRTLGDRIINNMLTLVLDPRRFGTESSFGREIDALLDYVTASPPRDPSEPVLVPGDPEREAHAERAQNGIPMVERAWAEIVDAAEQIGLAREEIEALAR